MGFNEATGKQIVVKLDEFGFPETTEEEQEFEDAASAVRRKMMRGEAAPDDALLDLYGLYKQAINGDCEEDAPSIIQWNARQKWKSWKSKSGMSSSCAMQNYIEAVSSIFPGWREDENMDLSLGTVPAHLTSYDEDPEVRSKTLHSLAHIGDDEGIREQLLEMLDVDERDEEQRTPLHWAADKGHLKVVEILLQKGANPNSKDEDGATPLHNAVICEHMDVCNTLLAAGADPNIMDAEGDTVSSLWPSTWPGLDCYHE